MKFKGMIMALASITMIIGLSGCGTTASSASKDSGSKQATSKEDKLANQGLLTQYEMNVQAAIRLANQPFKNLTAMLDQPEFDAATAKATAQQAEKANQDLKDKLAKVNVPKGFSKDTKTTLSSAMTDLQTAFDKRSEAVKSVENVKSLEDLKTQLATVDKAGADSFQSFMDKANGVNKKMGTIETDYTQELK